MWRERERAVVAPSLMEQRTNRAEITDGRQNYSRQAGVGSEPNCGQPPMKRGFFAIAIALTLVFLWLAHQRSARASLPPPLKPTDREKDYWVMLHVILSAPDSISEGASSPPAAGYYRNFGIRAEPRALRDVLIAIVEKDPGATIDWDDSGWEPVDWSQLDSVIRRGIRHEKGKALWYESGRIFHPPDAEPQLEGDD